MSWNLGTDPASARGLSTGAPASPCASRGWARSDRVRAMKTAPILLSLSVSLSVASLAACGDDDGGVDCGAFTACGGDPVGTWSIQGACIDPNAEVIPGCDEATSSGTPHQTGTVTL